MENKRKYYGITLTFKEVEQIYNISKQKKSEKEFGNAIVLKIATDDEIPTEAVFVASINDLTNNKDFVDVSDVEFRQEI